MKKKFLHFKLLGVFVLALSLSFVGCKDYDDDIDNLQGQIDGQTSSLTTKITAVENAITTLQSKDTELKTEITGLQSTITALQAQLTATDGKITSEAARLAAEAQLAATTAKQEAIADAAAKLEVLKGELKGEIDAVKAGVASNETRLIKMDADMAAIIGEITAINESIATLEGEVSAINTSITAMGATITTLNSNLAEAILEIARNKEKIELQAETLAKYEEALAKFQAEMAAYMSATDADINGIKDDVEDVLKALDAANDKINTLETDLGIANGKIGSLEGVLGDLGAMLGTVEGELAAVQRALDTLNALEEMAGLDLAQLEEMVKAINGDLNTMKSELLSTMSKMITGIRLVSTVYNNENRLSYSLNDNTGADMNFNIARAITDFDFGLTKGYENGFVNIASSYVNGFKFTTGVQEVNALSRIMIQVSPANAILTQDDLERISLIDTNGSTAVNNLLKIIKIEKFREVLTRGLPTETGLYEITFELMDVSLAAHRSITYTGLEANYGTSKKIAFAVAVENAINGATNAERHVLSTFGVVANLVDRESVYTLDFNVNTIKVGNLANRFFEYTNATDYYGLLDYKWNSGAIPKNNVDPTDTTYKSVDQDDVRGSKDFLYVGIGKTFTVKFDEGKQPYAYYVVLDKGGAGLAEDPSVSEINAWNSYSYTGLKKVVYGDQSLALTINSPEANTDIIGFRVIAINADGTLVDPDGKAFYVYCGELETRPALNFEMTFSDFQTSSINKEAFTFSAGSIVKGEVNLSIRSYKLTNTDMIFYDADGAVISSSPLALGNAAEWAKVRSVGLNETNVIAKRLTDNIIHRGTIDLFIKPSTGGQFVKVATVPVTVKKTLPTAFGANLQILSGQSSPFKFYPKPNTGATLGTYYFKNAFSYIVNSVSQPELNSNIQFGLVPYSSNVDGMNFTQTVSQNVTVIPGLIGRDDDGYLTYRDMNAYYNYGDISTTATTTPFRVAWTPGFSAAFCSYMEESVYNWSAAQTITYNMDNQYINLNLIEVTPPYGKKFHELDYSLGWTRSMIGINTINGTPDGARYKDITKAYMEINGVLSEYFNIDVVRPTTYAGTTSASRLLFKKNTDNTQSGPTTDLNAKIILEIVDDFNRPVKVTINGSFIMKAGS